MTTLARRLALAATIAMCALALHTPIAAACGGYTLSEEDLVRWTVEDHLAAVKAGDTALFDSAWSEDGTHVTMSPAATGFRVESEPIGVAFARWAKTPDATMSSTIETIEVDGTSAFARVSVTWHGVTYTEYLTLRLAAEGWKLVEKMHVGAHPTAPAVAVVSVY